MLFSDDSFKLGGNSVRAIITGNSESAVSACYLSGHGSSLRARDGFFSGAVSVQTMGGYFTCLVPFKLRELAPDVDIALGLDWLAYFREHLSELGALDMPSSVVRRFSSI